MVNVPGDHGYAGALVNLFDGRIGVFKQHVGMNAGCLINTSNGQMQSKPLRIYIPARSRTRTWVAYCQHQVRLEVSRHLPGALSICFLSMTCRTVQSPSKTPARFDRPPVPNPLPTPVNINLLFIRNGYRAARVQAATNFCFSFDFDEWSRLAKDDPSAFEARRIALIEAYLRQFPPTGQQRLRGLQFRIDMVRRRARTPMGACLKISSMMWESLLGRHGLKTALDTLLGNPNRSASEQRRPRAPATAARIIPFKRPTR